MGKKVKKHMETGSWEKYYREYQFELARDYLIPLLVAWGVDPAGKAVLEVGSGNGGCGEAFARAGGRVTALEIDERLVGVSRRLNEEAGVDIEVHPGDVCDPGCSAFSRGPFDLVLMRDVVEHLEDPVRALLNVRGSLAPEGAVFVVFPPYYSPYGAHQQILERRTVLGIPFNKLPYIQLLPDPVFFGILGCGSGKGPGGEGGKDRSGPIGGTSPSPDPRLEEVVRLRRIRLTMACFERAMDRAGFHAVRTGFYLSRPTFAVRYGLPVVRAGVLGRVPLLRELLVTGACYLIEAS